jgi:hypothetical protein
VRRTWNVAQKGGESLKYVNQGAGLEIDLSCLTEVEKKFYRRSLRKLQEHADWLAFDEFAFGMHSPIYAGSRSHLEVLRNPLYLALKDMSLQLGIQQGKISGGASRKPAGKKQRKGYGRAIV